MNNITSGGRNCSGSYHTPTGFIILGVSYVIMIVISFVGNTLVISTVSINGRMHTVTNYLIINMAVADLLITVVNMLSTAVDFLSPKASYRVAGDLGIAICKLIPFVQSLSVGSTVLNMNAIAIDRFFAVVFPLRRYVTLPIAYVMMVVVWLVAICVSAPLLYAMNVTQSTNGNLYCKENWSLEDSLNSSSEQDYTIVLFLFFYAVPLVSITVLYSIIIYKLWIRKVPGQRCEANEQQADKAKKKVLRMLLVVVIVFTVCWLPLYISQFWYYFGADACGPPGSLWYFGYFIAHGNSAINPWLYPLFNANFRKGFRDILLCRCRGRRVKPNSTTMGLDNTFVNNNRLVKLNVTSFDQVDRRTGDDDSK